MYQTASIRDIKTATFKTILAELQEEDWTVAYSYDGFDKGIDFDQIDLVNDGIKLKFEWDNWYEGVIEGPEKLLIAISTRFDLKKPEPLETEASQTNNS